MGDWQELANASFIAIIFAFMLAKLISLVVSFREDNLRVERERDASPSAPLVRQVDPVHAEKHNPSHIRDETDASTAEQFSSESDEKEDMDEAVSKDEYQFGEEKVGSESVSAFNEAPQGSEENVEQSGGAIEMEVTVTDSSLTNEGKESSAGRDSLLSDSDEWEGVESTELEETFSAASSFVAAMSLDPSLKISSDLQLQFYGLYKQATEGSCSTPQPSAYKMTARAKWHAWQTLGDISSEEAMLRYITLLSELQPNWNGHAKKGNNQTGDQDEQPAGSSDKKSGMGPVFSMLVDREGIEEGGSLGEIHVSARDGNIEKVRQLLEGGTPVDQRDSEDRAPLHWAVDRGHLEVVKLLVSKGAQINMKDIDGQTALHYATNCEWEEIAKFLLENGADISAQDNEGDTPYGSSCTSADIVTESI